jgi:hypothetical protein
MIERVGGRVVASASAEGLHVEGLRVNGTAHVFFRVARHIAENKEHCSRRWMIQRRRLSDGWIVVIRLGENNESILDYLLVPAVGTDRDTIRFSEKDLCRLGMDRFETSAALVRSVSRRVTRPSRASLAKAARPTKQSKSNQTKVTRGRVRR